MGKFIDMTDKKVGHLTFIEYEGNQKWKCRCDCGNIVSKFKNCVITGSENEQSCGCVEVNRYKEKYVGKSHDFLTVEDVRRINGKLRLIVKCVCGKTIEMLPSRFDDAKVKSCGCKQNELISGKNAHSYKTGLSGTRVYNVYHGMMERCYNPKHKSFKNYGGRGIKVCEAWHNFNNFMKWAYSTGLDEDAPIGKCTLDRIDPNGNYCPENCRWTDMIVQSNNKRNNRLFEINGITKTLSEWCREYNADVYNVHQRLKYGWDIIDALTTPKKKQRKDMTPEELKAADDAIKENARRYRESHKEQIRASRKKYELNNPEKVKESKRKYEERQKAKRNGLL